MAVVSIRRKLAAALRPLRTTPLHPQWHVARYTRRLTRYITEHASGLILDVGCGRMEIEKELALGRHHYIGLDFPATADDWYHTRPRIYGDGQQLPIRSGCADVVLLTNVLEHLRDPDACMSEACRVLKYSGLCIMEVPFLYPIHDAPLDFSRWTRHGLENLLQKSGLRTVSITAMGKPAETNALLLNIAISHSFVQFLARRNPLLVLAPLLPAIFLVLNVVSYLVAAVSRSELMPYSYWIVATKHANN